MCKGKRKKRVLPKYEDGNEVVITPDCEYNQYLNTLPSNQRFTQESDYSQHRYWQLNDKPKTFAEAIGKGMFTYEDDGYWHGNSIAYNKDKDEYEFMKRNNHPTRWMEDVFGYWQNPEFQKEWKLERSLLGEYGRDKYIRRNKSIFPKYEDGLIPYADDLKEIGAGMIPIYGTYRDIKTAIDNPTWNNIGWAGLSAIGDAMLLSGVLSGGGSSNQSVKKRKSSK